MDGHRAVRRPAQGRCGILPIDGIAELNLSGTGGIDIPAGVTQTFAAATVNGEPVEERDYTKGDGSVVAPFLLGEGTLRVRHAAGMMLMVQ